MADYSNGLFHIWRLSSLDQSAGRRYTTVAFFYPCEPERVNKAIDGFISSVKRTISLLPILAGIIRPASDMDGYQRGYVEVAVSLDMINSFEIPVKYLNGPDSKYIYDFLHDKRFPVSNLEIAQLAALPQKPDLTGGKSFAAQLNVISGGVIAVLQLHQAVADLAGVRDIIRMCTSGDASRNLTNEIISDIAVGSSKSRDLLSNTYGFPVPTPEVPLPPSPGLMYAGIVQPKPVTCVLSFNLESLNVTTELINSHGNRVKIEPGPVPWHNPKGEQTAQIIDSFHLLAALLWQGITRARKAAQKIAVTPTPYDYEPVSRIFLPMNVRERTSPELKHHYFGNATANAETRELVSKFDVSLDPGTLRFPAQHILLAMNDVTDRVVRLAIGKTKQSNYKQGAHITPATGSADIIVTGWSDLDLLDDASLSLGLGQPSFVRKLSDTDDEDGCVIYPYPTEGELWDVSVTSSEAVIDHMLADESFMKFVAFADGERYVNGLNEWTDWGSRINVSRSQATSQSC